MSLPLSWRTLLARSGSRREFLARGASVAGAAALGSLAAPWPAPVLTRWRPAVYPFTLGVSSGDPIPEGVVLWTRLAPDPMNGGGMPPNDIGVRWEVAEDDAFERNVRIGLTIASARWGHSVHVEVNGLEPGRHYWYRFVVGGESSPVGRTRTAPAAEVLNERFRFAFASCQHYETGLYTAHRHLAAEDVDLVVFLGDYIYEGGIGSGQVRLHDGPEIETLDQYRNRYALYKLDPDLQASHAAFPFLVTWDDHEVENNYASAISEDTTVSPAAFLLRRAAAYQAYYEHMPLRQFSIPTGPDMRLYRWLPYGRLAQFSVLDTRQFRTDQPCGDGVKVACAGAVEETATITGSEQERWLMSGLSRSKGHWNIIANQVPFARLDSAPGPEARVSMDKWDGYDASRRRLTDFLVRARPSNPVFITGDVHANFAMDVKENFDEPNSRTVAVELIGTSISSGGDGADTTRNGQTALDSNPHLKFYNGQRGYVRCTVTPQSLTSEFRVVPYVSRPGSAVETRAMFQVENAKPGLVKV